MGFCQCHQTICSVYYNKRNGPIKSCHSCLASLVALLPPTMGQSQTGKRRKLTLVDLAWPLKQSKVRKLLAEISHHKATLLLAMSGDMSRDLKEIRVGIERLQGTISVRRFQLMAGIN
ncbi:hypothetical protein QWA68_008438 [Fusarium oxysporum]|nr:hypothetical protein QWA68_008438 [Fusarium oxysporum]